MQKRPKEAEKEACLTLRELEQLFVAYLVNRYNQRLDARMGNQTRSERWKAGLNKQLVEIPERQLDICLMKQTRRTIYRGGYLQFENLTYQSDDLAAHAGETVVLRYDPRDITSVLVYRQEARREASQHNSSEQVLKGIKEIFIAPAHVQDLEDYQLSLEEAKEISRNIRTTGKAVNHQAMVDESHDREAFLDQKKKTRRDRQKEEQADIRTKPQKIATPQPELNPQPEIQEFEIPQMTVWEFDGD